jgi:hypothetical protein
MKTLGGRDGTARLLEIVRREGGDGGPEALDFNYVNCSNWLNKYVNVNVLGTRSVRHCNGADLV